MDYQESLLLCADAQKLTRLCEQLNKASLDKGANGLEQLELEVMEIGRLKKEVPIVHPHSEVPMCVLPKGCFLVWLGGERGPQQDWLYGMKGTPPAYPYESVFIEFVQYASEMLEGIEQGRPGVIQENEWMRTFHPCKDGLIDLSLIEKL